VAAARAGADVFIVPTDELDEADDAEDDLTVFGAHDLPQALSVLRSTG
jgi:PDZ domain-containing secreted protein